MQTNELYHHGVKGMKWGVRRKRPEYGNGSSYRTDNGYNNPPRTRSTRTQTTAQKPVVKEKPMFDENDSYIPKDTYNKIKRGMATASNIVSIANMGATLYTTAINANLAAFNTTAPLVNKAMNTIGQLKPVDLIKKP